MALNEVKVEPSYSSTMFLEILGFVAVIIIVGLWTYGTRRSAEEWRHSAEGWRRLLDIEKAKVRRLREKLQRSRDGEVVSDDDAPASQATTPASTTAPENDNSAFLFSRLALIQSSLPTTPQRTVRNLLEQVQIYEEILRQFREQEANLMEAFMEKERRMVTAELAVQSLQQQFLQLCADREREIQFAQQERQMEKERLEYEILERGAWIGQLEGRNRDLERVQNRLVQDFNRSANEELDHASRILRILRLREHQGEQSSMDKALKKEFKAIIKLRRISIAEMGNILRTAEQAAGSSSSS